MSTPKDKLPRCTLGPKAVFSIRSILPDVLFQTDARLYKHPENQRTTRITSTQARKIEFPQLSTQIETPTICRHLERQTKGMFSE